MTSTVIAELSASLLTYAVLPLGDRLFRLSYVFRYLDGIAIFIQTKTHQNKVNLM